MGSLDGKVALVTGGGRGIRRGISLVLAEEGASARSLILTWQRADDGGRASRPRRPRHGRGVRCDERGFGGRCGGTRDRRPRRHRHPGEQRRGRRAARWRRADRAQRLGHVHEVNLRGTSIMSRAVVQHFRERGAGKIVNIASIAGRGGRAGMAHYNASKAAVINLTQSLAMDLGPANRERQRGVPRPALDRYVAQPRGHARRDETPEVVERRAGLRPLHRHELPATSRTDSSRHWSGRWRSSRRRRRGILRASR